MQLDAGAWLARHLRGYRHWRRRRRARYRSIPGAGAQFGLLFHRAGVKWVRNWGYKVMDLLLVSFAALVVGETLLNAAPLSFVCLPADLGACKRAACIVKQAACLGSARQAQCTASELEQAQGSSAGPLAFATVCRVWSCQLHAWHSLGSRRSKNADCWLSPPQSLHPALFVLHRSKAAAAACRLSARHSLGAGLGAVEQGHGLLTLPSSQPSLFYLFLSQTPMLSLVHAGSVHGTAWELEQARGNTVMAMLTLAVIATVSSLQVFGKDRLIFWRESASGAAQPLPCLLCLTALAARALSGSSVRACASFGVQQPGSVHVQPLAGHSCTVTQCLVHLVQLGLLSEPLLPDTASCQWQPWAGY